ncbi:MAG: peptidase S1 [Polaromonas sp. 39-63-203]|jgi:S1-C subfamily serine protease|uniref:S1C family serine protease n=1 Tax=Polaromonas sp. TaxID=1869339 RepID=UPI000BDC450C|nr:trypsin-like peptidase domain-containing protein [Polaromonas sp.]OYY53666.1 MAG: peptidase S1 [Polaromonas sp. 35-63-240]OYZ03321.1 MAG: peptidase S1 [Polaromonas sp. 28-63-22]OYZ85142.1 MAG: peptidase S1 [Polaromonas sp. 24-62-144]OZB02449.1 MAG: peptidase S1 [Polaromonas sp. 39-63-203]HQS30604.1 trypsin-like peptidase domain-containing protein [Polaromonas sp.]
MRRPALYSSSRSSPSGSGNSAQDGSGSSSDGAPAPATLDTDDAPAHPSRFGRLSTYLREHHLYVLWGVVGLLALMLTISLSPALRPATQRLTQKHIDAAVLKTLNTAVLPSPAAKAYAVISPSVVRVVGLSKSRIRDGEKKGEKGDGKEERDRSVGTGVVITDKGIILTNLHVVQGAESIKVVFSDGLESTASVTGVQPENDLAVLQAHKIPDDMIAATMRSTADLAPGERVMAVGYPFGIGPSASAGIISGLKRTFRSPEGKQQMSNLIQFDAAANPGNSGGPLVTMEGEVIGVVTAIYNPNEQRTFVGIGFAVPIENAASAAGLPPF